MSLRSILSLTVGLLLVLAVTAGGTLLLDRRLAQATSETASVAAGTLDVGTDFSGTVSDTLVATGDEVTVGEPLFTVQAPQLQKALREGSSISMSTEAYQVADDGTVTYLSPGNGVVTALTATDGTFVATGTTMATIAVDDSLYVSATFDLTPREYARIEQGAAVEIALPNATTVAGAVESVTVQTIEGRALATVTVASPELAAESISGFYSPGTPVVARMALEDTGPLAVLADAITDFGKKIGL